MNTTKLDNIKTKFEQLTGEISDPAVIADTKTWTKLCKEHSSLQPIVEKYDEYRKILSDIEGAREIIEAGDDPPAERKPRFSQWK